MNNDLVEFNGVKLTNAIFTARKLTHKQSVPKFIQPIHKNHIKFIISLVIYNFETIKCIMKRMKVELQ